MSQIEIKILLQTYFSYRDDKNIDDREINSHLKALLSLCYQKDLNIQKILSNHKRIKISKISLSIVSTYFKIELQFEFFSGNDLTKWETFKFKWS